MRAIVFAGADGLFINIYADGGTCAEFEGGNGQNAGAAAVVQYAFAAFELRVEPFEAEAGGRMAACTEGKARVELQVDGVAVGRFVPRRGNPQAVGNLNRVELRLGQAYPVLIFKDFAGVFQIVQTAFLRGGFDNGSGVVAFAEKGDDFALLPDLLGRHARLAKNGLLVFCTGVGIFNGGGQCTVFHQRVGKAFGDGIVDVDGDLLIGHGGAFFVNKAV